MTKKFEGETLTSNIGHYYASDTFVRFTESMYLQKELTKKTNKPKFKGCTSYTERFTEVHDVEVGQFLNERLSWYDAIESGKLKPSIDQNGNVRLLANDLVNSRHLEWCEQIETIASKWIDREIYRNSQIVDQGGVDLILQALAQLSRYLPEFQQRKPNYFLDVETYKIGVTLQGEGTLTLLIGRNSEVEYSYAQRQDKGSIRISGIAKLTTNVRNSKNIWKLLHLQGIVR